MVAFCALCTIQSISCSPSEFLSDWCLFRVAVLQELVAELESQAAVRHELNGSDSMSVVDAMARQLSRELRLLLCKKSPGNLPADTQFVGLSDDLAMQQLMQLDDLAQFTGTNNAIPFMPDWDFASILTEGEFAWDAYPEQVGGSLPMLEEFCFPHQLR
jgi:hypothetical protein